jgi:hypothetical protein
VLVSTDGHVGPSLTGQLRGYCPEKHLEDFDAYAAANAGPVAFVGAKEMFDKQEIPQSLVEARRLAFECPGQQDPHEPTPLPLGV